VQAANKGIYEQKRALEAHPAAEPIHSNKLTDAYFPGGY